MKYLYLDDERMPAATGTYMFPVELRPLYLHENWIVVRTYEQFVSFILKEGLPDVISFDHDLSFGHYTGDITKSHEWEKTGYTCAQWLVDFCAHERLPLPTCYVHSMNPVGAANIEALLKNYQKSLQKELLDDIVKRDQEMGLYDIKSPENGTENGTENGDS